MKPAVAVIGFAARQPLSPRGERVNVIAEALSRVADVELISAARHPEGRAGSRQTRRIAGNLARTIWLDVYEPESIRVLRRWPASVDAALLIGFPFSPLPWAARRLAAKGVPYVVDVGDPWVLTAGTSRLLSPATLRARRGERFIWRHAAGGIVTTELQAKALRDLFPRLPVLVRPNGFAPVVNASVAARRRDDPTVLRCVHYGNMYSPRLDLSTFLTALAASGEWKEVRLTLHGYDWDGRLRRTGAGVEILVRPPEQWRTIVATASEHDVALVVGNHNPAQLPSKAVQYLTLPIPRAALVSGSQG